MAEVALVANEHNDNVRVGVVPELLEPALNVFVRHMLRNVVHQQRANRAAVVPTGSVNNSCSIK